MNPIQVLREAWSLYQSNDSWETVAAAVLAAVVLIPPAVKLYKARQQAA